MFCKLYSELEDVLLDLCRQLQCKERCACDKDIFRPEEIGISWILDACIRSPRKRRLRDMVLVLYR